MGKRDENNIQLRTRLSEALTTLNLIIIIYAIFIAIIGIALNNTEAIIQACIMMVVYVIFKYLNDDVTRITNKGINNRKYGSIEWNKIYRVQREKNIINLYTKENKKPYKILINKSEDETEVSRAYKYILSKIKSPEKLKKQ